MRERLIQYVDLLFAGAPNSTEIKQEILQNTLDRYDDLVAQGKSEEAAYRLAISGIGDISEILDAPVQEASAAPQEEAAPIQTRRLRAAAIAMYVACAVPLFILSELGYSTLGLCLTILLVAAATYVMILSRQPDSKKEPERKDDPNKPALNRIVYLPAIALWFLLSITTHAWIVTWLIFPIAACVRGLINAIMDLKEENPYEN